MLISPLLSLGVPHSMREVNPNRTLDRSMAIKPDIGSAGGQEYPVLRSIQTFLRQMAEGGARPAPMIGGATKNCRTGSGALDSPGPSAFMHGFGPVVRRIDTGTVIEFCIRRAGSRAGASNFLWT